MAGEDSRGHIRQSLFSTSADVAHGRELLLADTTQELAQACVRLLGQPQEAAAMAERAWCRFLERWIWDSVAPKVWAAAEDALRRSAAR
jgi:hypothetical protein